MSHPNFSNNSTLAEDYYQLDPDTIIAAVESKGYISDARILALNSYENRVYQVGIEEAQPIIAKFYRPLRWSDEQIREEHQFCKELYELDIPVVPPIVMQPTELNSEPEHKSEDPVGNSLFYYGGYRFALYQRRGGRAPELTDPEQLYRIGKLMGRIHAAGKSATFQYRPSLSIEAFIIRSSEYILNNDFLPTIFIAPYQAIIADLLKYVEARFQQIAPRPIRLHGDCHPGNILWTDQGPHFVDFDDSRNGPAIQDLWMLLSGETHEQEKQLREILEGYEEYCDFNAAELNLIESLRCMRMIHYAGWLAKRWHDPAFPKAFPWFNTETYWGEHILQLKEQLSALQEPALQIYPMQ